MSEPHPTDSDTDSETVNEQKSKQSGALRKTRRFTLKAMGAGAIGTVAMSGSAAAHPSSEQSSESGESSDFVGCGCGRWCRGTAEGSGRGDASGDGYLRSTPPRGRGNNPGQGRGRGPPEDGENRGNGDSEEDEEEEENEENEEDEGSEESPDEGEDDGEDDEQSEFAQDTDIVIESVFYSEGADDNPAVYIRNSNQELPLDTRDWSFVTDMVREQTDFEGGVIPPGGILTIRPEEGVFLDAANGGLILLFNEDDEVVANAGYPQDPEYSPGDSDSDEDSDSSEGEGEDEDETDGTGPDEGQEEVDEDVPDESDGDADTGDGDANEDEEDAETTPGEIEGAIHEEINAFRSEEGLSEIELSEDLTEVARSHSEDMAEQNYFSHTSPDGDGPGDRLAEAEIDFNAYGENIAYEYSPGFRESDAADVAESIVDGWLESDGHRDNILGDYSEQGVGVAVDGQEIFATELLTN